MAEVSISTARGDMAIALAEEQHDAIAREAATVGLTASQWATFVVIKEAVLLASEGGWESPTDTRLEGEAYLLGRLMAGTLDNPARFGREMFVDPWNRIVAAAVETLTAAGRVPDPVTVARLTAVPELCADNPLPYLAEMVLLAECGGPPANILAV